MTVQEVIDSLKEDDTIVRKMLQEGLDRYGEGAFFIMDKGVVPLFHIKRILGNGPQVIVQSMIRTQGRTLLIESEMGSNDSDFPCFLRALADFIES